MHQHQRQRKTLIIFAFFVCCIAVIIGRLIMLQVVNQKELEALGSKNFTRIEHHAAPRGNFYDCNNVLLTTNKPLFDVYWQGCGNRILSREQQDNLKRLSIGSIRRRSRRSRDKSHRANPIRPRQSRCR